MTLIVGPGLAAPRRNTATPRLNLPMSRILTSRSPPRAATVWISSPVTIVASVCAVCENPVDGANTTTEAANPRVIIARCMASPLLCDMSCGLSALRSWWRRNAENLCRVHLEQLRQFRLGESIRAQHLRALGQRIRLEHGVDLPGVARHERVVDAGRAN